MISAVIWEDCAEPGRIERRERTVRSLVWLVSAVVNGIVRDVVLAVPSGLDLAEIADQAGCALSVSDVGSKRFAAAARECRCDWVLVLRRGFQPVGDAAQEIESQFRQALPVPALALAAPRTFWQRLLPDRAPAVGALVPRAWLLENDAVGLSGLARRIERRLATRFHEIP